jgi:hypothetical protein
MEELTGDEITNSNLQNNPNVRAVLTGQVPVPTGYTYVEGTSTSESTKPENGSWGVVVKDGSDNEWVWVPVNANESIAPSGAFETISATSIAQANIENRKLATVFDGVQLASLDGLKGILLATTEEEEEEPAETVTTIVTKKSASDIIDRPTINLEHSYIEPALVTDYDLDPTYYKKALLLY